MALCIMMVQPVLALVLVLVDLLLVLVPVPILYTGVYGYS